LAVIKFKRTMSARTVSGQPAANDKSDTVNTAPDTGSAATGEMVEITGAGVGTLGGGVGADITAGGGAMRNTGASGSTGGAIGGLAAGGVRGVTETRLLRLGTTGGCFGTNGVTPRGRGAGAKGAGGGAGDRKSVV
jgi:hypothetical protein